MNSDGFDLEENEQERGDKYTSLLQFMWVELGFTQLENAV